MPSYLSPSDTKRPEYALLGIGVVGLVALYVWGAHYWIDLVDEGYFVYTSSRVLAGDLPYRDFATPYTPGFFYLNAQLFRLFGEDVLPPRIALCLVRGGVVLLLYLVGRRIMRPAFALLPVFMFIGQDYGPTLLEVHPAWYALLFALLAVWAATRYLDQWTERWLVLAGMAAALSFAFKQNAGVLALLALGGLVILEGPPPWRASGSALVERVCQAVPRELSRRVVLSAAAVYFLVVLVAACYVMRPHLDTRAAVLLLAPLVALAGLMVGRRLTQLNHLQSSNAPVELATVLWRLILLGIGFTSVTLSWLVPLLLTLGISGTPLAVFVGSIDQRAYFHNLPTLKLETILLLLVCLLAPLVFWRAGRAAAVRQRTLEVALLLGALSLLSLLIWQRALAAYKAPSFDPLWLIWDVTTSLVLYLPVLAFWPAFLLCLLGAIPSGEARYLRWYLLAGSLLLLKQYPRMDETHLIFSGPLVWLPGAYALSRSHRRLLEAASSLQPSRLAAALAFTTLLGLPIAAVWPSVVARLDEITGRDAGMLEFGERQYVTLDVHRASVMVEEGKARELRSTVSELQARSKPEERIFVYPAAPLLYYLADRPNATRFNHVLPGLLSAEEEAEAIYAIERAPAVLVVWDALNALAWERDGMNRRLTDYIWARYEVATTVADFVIMERKRNALTATGSLD